MARLTFRAYLTLLTGASVVACAPLFDDSPTWKPSPGTHAVTANLKSSIGYYDNAVSAINGRHYGLALEYLQAARAANPNDVRVLTAFGVVYDKLGRFDLSTRYYEAASAIDPHSEIVARDMDYSLRLQALTSPKQEPRFADATEPNLASGSWPRTPPAPLATAATTEASASNALPFATKVSGTTKTPANSQDRVGAKVASASSEVALTEHLLGSPPGAATANGTTKTLANSQNEVGAKVASAIRGVALTKHLVGFPPVAATANGTTKALANSQNEVGAKVASTSRGMVLTGHPLVLINGTGRDDAAGVIGRRLSGLGWSVAKPSDHRQPISMRTTIYYEQTMVRVAKALARTLAMPTQLTASANVNGLQLILGNDMPADLGPRLRTKPVQYNQVAAATAVRKSQD